MPKKTTILIVVLLLFTAGLVYIAIQTEQGLPPSITEETLTEEELTDLVPTINPQTQILFTPAEINTAENPQQSHSVDVSVNTNGQRIAGVQLELSYDPAILTNITVNASENNLFGTNPAVLINTIDSDLGRISFAIALGGLSDEEITGIGNIATINFSTISNPTPTTQITILPKTTVRSLQSTNSLLQESMPLNIILSSPAAQTTDPAIVPPENQAF